MPGFPTLNACTAAMCEECIIFQLLSVHRIMCTNNSIFLRKNLDGKEVRYDERVFGRDENDQGSGVASEGFF